MPRGQKSKLRAREKRRQNKAETQGVESPQAATAEKEEATSSSSPVSSDGPTSSPVAGTLPAPLSVPATPSTPAGVSCRRSDGGAKSHVKKNKNPSQASASTQSSGPDLLSRKACKVVHLLLCKFKMNEPIKKVDMLKVVHKRYREQFPEILKKASERLDLVFGLELKEVKPNGHSYTVVCKQDDTSDESLSSAWRFPTKGILMPLLGVIYLHGNCASERDIWKFLNNLGVYDGQTHFIFGEPRKLITQDLVKEKYLQYRQVRNSDPPRYVFLWGPRAQAETTKMKVLEFLCKINNTVPSALPGHYEEALRDEEERARAIAATKASTTSKASAGSKASARSKAKSSRDSHPD